MVGEYWKMIKGREEILEKYPKRGRKGGAKDGINTTTGLSVCLPRHVHTYTQDFVPVTHSHLLSRVWAIKLFLGFNVFIIKEDKCRNASSKGYILK